MAITMMDGFDPYTSKTPRDKPMTATEIVRRRHHDPEIEAAQEAIREVLKRFTYRPHWRFEVNEGFLTVTMLVVDADEPDQNIVLTFTQTIPRYAFMHDFDWTRWLFEQVRNIEHHEMQEFFRIDGRPVYEPHPELQRAQVG